MSRHTLPSEAFVAAALAAALAPCVHAATDISQVPLATYSTASGSAEVKPNILMVLDDSSSMDSDFLPDWVPNPASNYLVTQVKVPYYWRYNAAYNGIYYNPAVTYLPPITFGAGGVKDTSRYPSMTGTSAATGADMSQPLPNWGKVPMDGFGVQTPSSVYSGLTIHSLEYHVDFTNDFRPPSGAAFYWYSLPGEYCNSANLTRCVVSDSPQPGFEYPAVLRWCKAADLQDCVATQGHGYFYPRAPAPRIARIDFADVVAAEITSIQVDGQEILAASTGVRSGAADLAAAVADQISACTYRLPAGSKCTKVGFLAYHHVDSTAVFIASPTPVSSTPAVTWNSATAGAHATITANPFARTTLPSPELLGTPVSTDPAPGEVYFVAITPTVAEYSYAGTKAKAPSRTDCAGTTCTYAEEMTNFANYQAYYRTRMQMMKTSLSRAFAALDSEGDMASGVTHYRTGYLSIDNGAGTDFVNLDDFRGDQKALWYTRVLAAKPSADTPLRVALSTAGRLYGGVLTGSTLNGTTVTDPLQYSCQRNFTILSTDGFWNGRSGTMLDGVTAVGNADSDLPRPYGGAKDADTLADVAAYYYNTDLRSPTATGADKTGTCVGPSTRDLCTNNVPPLGRDRNPQQHMTTSTLSLGAQGFMTFSLYQNDASGKRTYVPDYWQQQSGDFHDLAAGSAASPADGICPWMPAGATCTWPSPKPDSSANIDDLWHAAVNGRGTYFLADNPQALAGALKATLGQIANAPRGGTAAAAASSNPNVTSTDNLVFSSSYRSNEWWGDLVMQQMGPTGLLGDQQWSARQVLDCWTTPWSPSYAYVAGDSFKVGDTCYRVTTDYVSTTEFEGYAGGLDGRNTATMPATPASRTIYTANDARTGLVAFNWSELSLSQKRDFSLSAIRYVDATSGLSQFCAAAAACLDAASQDDAQGANLVDYLAGSRTNEGRYYRVRRHVLGDIVSSSAAYVKAPVRTFADAGYGAFKVAKADRPGTVYVGANDGMLHAFDALTGAERWAFIPSAVLPSLYRLADRDYAGKHRFLVDGTPAIADICPTAPTSTCSATDWKTILVGGLGAGGAAYFALDITDPLAPKLLWEFTDAHLGLAYGNPQVAKLKSGQWVVLFASGYNNDDGIGRLYVLDAATGAPVYSPLPTGAGTAATPSGLARIAARVPNAATDATIAQVYGGDLLGNMWRFDVNDTPPAAHLLVTVTGTDGRPQPITTKPIMNTVDGHPLVIFGTGEFLGVSDLTDTRTQSLYAVLDRGGTLPNPRSPGSGFVQQTMAVSGCPADAPPSVCTPGETVRTAHGRPVDWSSNNGWYLDFLLGGERSITDAMLALGTLAFTTVRPQAPDSSGATDPCASGTAMSATSYLYYLDYLTGAAVEGSADVVGNTLCTCAAAGAILVRTADGRLEAVVRTSGTSNSSDSTSTAGSGSDAGGSDAGGGTGRRGGGKKSDKLCHVASPALGAGGVGVGVGVGVAGGGDDGDGDGTGTQCQDLPYKPTSSILRKISWRDLNE